MALYEHILLATDLGDHSDGVVEKAHNIAEQTGAKISLLHIVEPLPIYGYGFYNPDLETKRLDEAEPLLAELGKKLQVPNSDQHLVVGHPKHEILQMAGDLKADLIVIGSHGHHGLGDLLGSTSSSVVNGAEVDVLVVRHPG